jgi:transposase-like protein
MIDSDAMKQIQKTIEILNSLNDNEKDLVLNDINSKLEPFKNDGTIKKKPNKKAAFRMEKTKIQLNKSVRVTSCPLCGSNNPNNIKKNGKDSKGHQRYLCKSCKKTFNTTTNSVTHCSKKSDKYWNLLIGGMLDNKTYKAIADEADTSVGTVYTHALRIMEQIVNTSKNELLEGQVQSDETYLLPNFKGDKKIYRYNFNGTPGIAHRKTDHELYGIPTASEIKNRQKYGLGLRGLSKDKICYCTAITEDYTFCGGPVKRGNIDEKSLSKSLLKNLTPKTLFVGDSSRANKSFVEKYNFKHELLLANENSRNGEYNLQKVNYLHSLIKEIMKSNRSFSTKHSEKYISFLAWKLKNKELPKEEQIELLKNMMLDNKKPLTWEEVRTTSFPIGEKTMTGNLHNHICHE